MIIENHSHVDPTLLQRAQIPGGGIWRSDEAPAMSHTIRDKSKLLNRVRRIAGQVRAVERALEAEAGCAEVLHGIAAARGAMNALMSEVLERYVSDHVLAPDDLVNVVRTYLR